MVLHLLPLGSAPNCSTADGEQGCQPDHPRVHCVYGEHLDHRDYRHRLERGARHTATEGLGAGALTMEPAALRLYQDWTEKRWLGGRGYCVGNTRLACRDDIELVETECSGDLHLQG